METDHVLIGWGKLTLIEQSKNGNYKVYGMQAGELIGEISADKIPEFKSDILKINRKYFKK